MTQPLPLSTSRALQELEDQGAEIPKQGRNKMVETLGKDGNGPATYSGTQNGGILMYYKLYIRLMRKNPCPLQNWSHQVQFLLF